MSNKYQTGAFEKLLRKDNVDDSTLEMYTVYNPKQTY